MPIDRACPRANAGYSWDDVGDHEEPWRRGREASCGVRLPEGRARRRRTRLRRRRSRLRAFFPRCLQKEAVLWYDELRSKLFPPSFGQNAL